jgi:hypothetical protein
MKNSKKDLNNKLKLDSIDWAEVVEALDSKEDFRDCDIKRALKKTGRSFNNNGPFHTTVRNFIKSLGDNVKTEMVNGEKVYTILQVPTKPCRKKESVVVYGPTVTATQEKEEIVATVSDEDKIKDLFNRSYKTLSDTIKLLAVFIKYEKKILSSEIIRSEFGILGINYTSFLHIGRPVAKEIFKRLDLFTFGIKRYGIKGSDWVLSGEGEVLEVFIKLQDIYKNLSGDEPENLDDYISSSKTEKKKEVNLKEIFKPKPKSINISREDEPIEIRWKKWLLLEALKSRQGASSSIESLVSWIKSTRHTKIDKNEATKLFRELQGDLNPGDIKFLPGDCVFWNDDKLIKPLFKFYDPRKIVEKVYVKIRMTPEEIRSNFPGLDFDIDEALDGGKYVYRMVLNRSYRTEIYLKKILRIVRISGAIYSTGSFMISRVSKILEMEDTERNMRENRLMILEEI